MRRGEARRVEATSARVESRLSSTSRSRPLSSLPVAAARPDPQPNQRNKDRYAPPLSLLWPPARPPLPRATQLADLSPLPRRSSLALALTLTLTLTPTHPHSPHVFALTHLFSTT